MKNALDDEYHDVAVLKSSCNVVEESRDMPLLSNIYWTSYKRHWLGSIIVANQYWTDWGRDKQAAISQQHFDRIFCNVNIPIFVKISLKFVFEGLINDMPVLVQILVWCRTDYKLLHEPIRAYFNDAYLRHAAYTSYSEESEDRLLYAAD